MLIFTGRPNNRWIDQLCRDNNNTPPADLWRRSTTRGHSGVTLRSSTTTRRRRQMNVTVRSTQMNGEAYFIEVKGPGVPAMGWNFF